MSEELTAVKDTEATKKGLKYSHAGPFIIRKAIRSTVYEVAVHFSQTSRETLKDKILRLIKNEVRHKQTTGEDRQMAGEE